MATTMTMWLELNYYLAKMIAHVLKVLRIHHGEAVIEQGTRRGTAARLVRMSNGHFAKFINSFARVLHDPQRLTDVCIFGVNAVSPRVKRGPRHGNHGCGARIENHMSEFRFVSLILYGIRVVMAVHAAWATQRYSS